MNRFSLLLLGFMWIAAAGSAAPPTRQPDIAKSGEGCEFRVWYLEKGTRSEGIHGTLVVGGKALAGNKTGETVTCSLGDFVWHGDWDSRRQAWAASGWLPKALGEIYPSYKARPIATPGPPASSNRSNLIRNGRFKNSWHDWLVIGLDKNPNHEEDPSRAVCSVADGGIELEIKNQGISPWSILLAQSIQLKKRTVYEISFEAKSDPDRTIVSNITQDETWKSYSGDQSFKLTQTMKRFTYQFSMDEDSAALFQLCLGMAGTGKIFIKNVTVHPGNQPSITAQKP
jgi:hypothetical protein